MSQSMIVVLIVILVLAVAAFAVTRARASRLHDGVDSFRRQIDALSPEARRGVVDQVQHAAGRVDPTDTAAPSGDDEDGDDGT